MDACLTGLCGSAERTPPWIPRDTGFAPDFSDARRLHDQLHAALMTVGFNGDGLRESIPEAIRAAARAC